MKESHQSSLPQSHQLSYIEIQHRMDEMRVILIRVTVRVKSQSYRSSDNTFAIELDKTDPIESKAID